MNLTLRRLTPLALALAFALGFLLSGAIAPPAQADDAFGLGALQRGPGGPGGPPEWVQCRLTCMRQGHEQLKTCLANGGDHKTCVQEAHAAVQACIEASCGNIQPPCRLGCAQAAHEQFKACVAGGGDPKTCGEQSRAQLKTCLESCPKPAWQCRAECQRSGHEAFKACVASGGDRQTCAAEAKAAVEACVTQNCGGSTTP
jgi:hypothetical protein